VTLGSGIDLMEVARFEREVARRGGSLVEELFSAGELAWCRRRRRAAEGYAMAYAAKEALFKALGTGKVGRMAWHDIEIAWPADSAQPAMALSGETAVVAADMGAAGFHVSLACTRELAVGWVVVTGFGTRDSCITPKRTLLVPQLNRPSPEPRAPSPESRPT
jgi:holo-[acyl-carrier protein] synthase